MYNIIIFFKKLFWK